MAKNWDYAIMAKDAAAAGGPDIWLKTIKEAAYKSGAADMKHTLVFPLIMTGIGIGAVGAIGCQKIEKWLAEKKKARMITEQEAMKAEEYLKIELKTAIDELEAENGGAKE